MRVQREEHGVWGGGVDPHPLSLTTPVSGLHHEQGSEQIGFRRVHGSRRPVKLVRDFNPLRFLSCSYLQGVAKRIERLICGFS